MNADDAGSASSVSAPYGSGDVPADFLRDLEERDATVEHILAEEREIRAAQLPSAICALDAPPPEPITWAVEGLILAGEIALFCGDSGSFKSTLALHIAGAMAGGYPVFGGRFPTEAQPVLYVSEEDPIGVLADRLGAIVAGHGWDRARCLGNVHVLARAGVSLTELRWQLHLRAEVVRLGAGLVVLDPWCEFLGALSESDNSEIRPVLQFVRSLTEDGATPLINHHVGKLAEGKRSVDRIRGASALNHASRSTYYFEDRGDSIGVECLKLSRAPRLPAFTITRRIEADPENRAMWRSATFLAVSARDLAMRFVLDALRVGSVTSTGLRDAAKGKGVSGEDVGRALRMLAERGQIGFDPGPRGAKSWHLVEQLDLARATGRVAKTTLPTLPDPAQGRVASPPSHPIPHPAPLKGGRSWETEDAVLGQPGRVREVQGEDGEAVRAGKRETGSDDERRVPEAEAL